MKRRTFLGTALAFAAGSTQALGQSRGRWDAAAESLERATKAKQVDAAVLHVVQKKDSFTHHFGKAASDDSMFLLGSISKPINVTALMTLYDKGKFRLDDKVKRFLPDFSGDERDAVTIRHLLIHTSGLPDQLPNNNALRKKHAPLMEFAKEASHTKLEFTPGTKYQYSSMGILLAARIAEEISGTDILTLVDRAVFQPLGMKHSAQGLGRFKLEDMVTVQMDGAAPESGAGDPKAKEWDWNVLAEARCTVGRDACVGPGHRRVSGRVPVVPRQGREAGDGEVDDREPEPGSAHAARTGVRRRQGIGQRRVLGKDLRPHRLDGDALLGRPRD